MPGERTPREVIEAYVDAMARADWALLRSILADDYVEDYPQSGERVRGREHAVAVRSHGRPEPPHDGAPALSRTELVVGGEERWALAPNFTAIRTTSGGDTITSLVRAMYQDGEWYVVFIGTVEDGQIHHATMVFGPLFEAPEWRKPLVEPLPERDR
jgi:hypothetical protein